MSFTELHKGKLRKLSSNPDKFAECFFKSHNIKPDKSYNTPLERLLDIYFDKYIVLNGSLYLIRDINLGKSDYNWSKVNENGEIEYAVQFHNGGCSLNEALEESLKGII